MKFTVTCSKTVTPVTKYHLNKLYSVETLGVLLARQVLYIIKLFADKVATAMKPDVFVAELTQF